MSKKPIKKDEPKSIQQQFEDMVLDIVRTVGFQSIGLSYGREMLGKWYNGLTDEQKREVSDNLYSLTDRIRIVGDGIHQEVASITAPFRT